MRFGKHHKTALLGFNVRFSNFHRREPNTDGIWSNPPKASKQRCFQHPVWRARASQPESGTASLLFEPEVRFPAPGELASGRFRREAQGGSRAIRGAFLWVLSCRDKKGPRLRVREPDSSTAAVGR